MTTTPVRKPARIAIYGAQFGSEGKACVAEYIIGTRLNKNGHKPVVLGENAPNSGHTCTKGKTRNIPASAYFASCVFLGPDSVIDPGVLCQDIDQVHGENPDLTVYIHEAAARCNYQDVQDEKSAGLEQRISSTVTGGGAARHNKQLLRNRSYTIGADTTWIPSHLASHIVIVRRANWLFELALKSEFDWVYEGSQGLMLDVNLGYYPYVTSRTTHPIAALARNGFLTMGERAGHAEPLRWHTIGTFRTYPIRTGGPSGPTGGDETTFFAIGVNDELATVTKRIRRVFKFSEEDFWYSTNVHRPDEIAFTHLDYLALGEPTGLRFKDWLRYELFAYGELLGTWIKDVPMMVSLSPSRFIEIGTLADTGAGADAQSPTPSLT